jgi:serine/threonine protein kinase
MPNRIGKYEITAEIGRGGFSRVYRGFDPNVNRPVAIKVSTRESDPEHLSRFRNEASAAGNLRHENIVTIHDYGDDEGVPYLVMELLEGRDLHHIMRDGPKLSTLEKMQVMSQVAEGLNCAHLNGVVHRDIKPANVMVLPDGTVKILDFGIARMAGEVSRLTQSGYLVGTPLYMSPEQLQGADADALCDVWAYGVLYFELLTGQHPFLSQDNTRLIRNITIVNPPSVHSLTRGVPEGLAQVIRRALTKDRRRRYQSLEDVLVDTNPILALLQREQTAGLVTEAQFYRNSGQLIAARRSSRRALEIDPSNYGAQQLLKSIQHEMQEEHFAEPQPTPPQPVAQAPTMPERRHEPVVPAAPARVLVPPAPVVHDQGETIVPAAQRAVARVALAPEPVMEQEPIVPPLPAYVAPPAPITASFAAAGAAPGMAYAATALDTPSSTTNSKGMRPNVASGAAAAIAAAVAAAKARQAEEEKLHQAQVAEEVSAPAIRAAPLVVTTLQAKIPAPAPTGTFKRPENGAGLFVTEDPLVVKRPADAVMLQRMSEREASAAVAEAPVRPAPPPPPTRLPGTKAIPASLPRHTNGTAESRVATPPSAPPDRYQTSENLPMRRPPSEVYAKGGKRRRSSNTLFTENQRGRSFPWLFVGVGLALAGLTVALFVFSWSSPMRPSAPSLLPEKLSFVWKPMTAFPPEQLLTLKGGAGNASYMASSEEDWLVITPEVEDSNNRTWQVKVEPDKLGQMVPGVNTGWVDVTSADGIKTTAEVTLKIIPGETTAPPVIKGNKKTQVPTPKAEQPTPTITTLPPATKKPEAAKDQPVPAAATGSVTDSAKTVGPKPAVKKPETPKKPTNDIDFN